MELKDAIKLVANATAEQRSKAILEILAEQNSQFMLTALKLINVQDKITMLKNIRPGEITLQDLQRLDVENYDLIRMATAIPELSDMLATMTNSRVIRQEILKNKIKVA